MIRRGLPQLTDAAARIARMAELADTPEQAATRQWHADAEAALCESRYLQVEAEKAGDTMTAARLSKAHAQLWDVRAEYEAKSAARADARLA